MSASGLLEVTLTDWLDWLDWLDKSPLFKEHSYEVSRGFDESEERSARKGGLETSTGSKADAKSSGKAHCMLEQKRAI